MRESYPDIAIVPVEDALRQIAFIREEDITAFQNLSQIFIGGRKVDKIPSSSNDVVADDQIGDFNWDATYQYRLIDQPSTQWVRIAHSTF